MNWFGAPVAEIRQISAYSCRGMNGQRGARISEHAFGNALDIAAFTLADGRKITVKDGWRGTPEEQGFLRDVQGAACQHFSTVLAPGSNAFHYDHIHVDLMRRASGGEICNPAADPGRRGGGARRLSLRARRAGRHRLGRSGAQARASVKPCAGATRSMTGCRRRLRAKTRVDARNSRLVVSQGLPIGDARGSCHRASLAFTARFWLRICAYFRSVNGWGPMRVVLVDPSRTMRLFVTRLLEARDHEVRPFADGPEALACMRAGPGGRGADHLAANSAAHVGSGTVLGNARARRDATGRST